MANIHKTALVPYTSEVMYNLVNDIESYSQFLPWCSGSRVLTCEQNIMTAQVDINKSAFKQSFTTRNVLYKNETIEMGLQDGPFKVLKGEWLFHPLKKDLIDGCKIELVLEWQFSNKITTAILGGVFSPIANKMVDSFVTRAHSLYSKP